MGRPSTSHYDHLFFTKLKSVCIHVLDQLNANNEIKEAFDLCHDISRRNRSIQSFLNQPNIYSDPASDPASDVEHTTFSNAQRRLRRASDIAQQDSDNDEPLASLPEAGSSSYAFPSLVNPDFTFEQLADHLDPDDKFIKRICEILIKETAKQAHIKKAEKDDKAYTSASRETPAEPITLGSEATTSFARRSFRALTQPYSDEPRHRSGDQEWHRMEELLAHSSRLVARMRDLVSSSDRMRLPPSFTGRENVSSPTQDDGNSSSNESLSARSRAQTSRELESRVRVSGEMVGNHQRRRMTRDSALESIQVPLTSGVGRWHRQDATDSAAQSASRDEPPRSAEEEVDPDVSLTRTTSLTRRNAIRSMPGNSSSSRSLASISSLHRSRAQEEGEDRIETSIHTSPPYQARFGVPAASPDGNFAIPERPRSRSFTFVTTPAAVLRRRLESGLDPSERLSVLMGDEHYHRLSQADSDAELDLDLGLALDEEAGSGASTPLEARRATFEAYARRRRIDGRDDDDEREVERRSER